VGSRVKLLAALVGLLILVLVPAQVVWAQVVNPPTNLTATAVGYYGVDLAWQKGSGTDKTMVVRKIGDYPASRDDGTEIYYGTGEVACDDGDGVGLDLEAAIYFYRAWGQDATEQWSDDYAQVSIGQLPPPIDYSQELGDIAAMLGALANNLTWLIYCMFGIGLTWLAVRRNEIVLYIAGFVGILLMGLDVAQTSWALGVPLVGLAGYMMYKAIRVYI